MKFLVLLSFLLACGSAMACELEGVRMPDQISEGGKNLLLNGMGLRTNSGQKIYVGGLYLENKSSDGDSIINSPEVKKISLQFLAAFPSFYIQAGWNFCFNKNCAPGECDDLIQQKQALISLAQDYKAGEGLELVFSSKSFDFFSKGVYLARFNGEKFSRKVLSCWLGVPANPELKSGMLGANACTGFSHANGIGR